jgi:hypothetical protein
MLFSINVRLADLSGFADEAYFEGWKTVLSRFFDIF